MSDPGDASFPYRLEDGVPRPRLGLIVLQVDETIEPEFRRLFRREDATPYVSRIASGADLTPETIAGMEHELPRAAALLPPSVAFDAIGYACTSATTQLGAARVEELVRRGARARHVTDPFSAALAAFAALEVTRVAIVSPYVRSVAATLSQAFEASGLQIVASLSFGEREEARVARIARASIRDAAIAAGRAADAQAVFLSCTNLPTIDVIDEVETALGKPVVSSNLALAWRMATLAGVGLSSEAPGRLAAA